jgi:hypothetical protein
MLDGDTDTEHCGAMIVSFHVLSGVCERTTVCENADGKKPTNATASAR